MCIHESLCTKILLVQGFRVSKLSLSSFNTTRGQAYDRFCSLLMVYRVPDFYYIFYTNIKERKKIFGFCTKELVVQGFRVLHLSLYTTLLLLEVVHKCVMLVPGD